MADRSESYTVIWDSNREVNPQAFPTTKNVVLPGGKIQTSASQAPSASTAIGVGWSKTPVKKLLGKDDTLPEDCFMGGLVTITEPVTYYAIWGEDANDNGQADVLEKVHLVYQATKAKNMPADHVAPWTKVKENGKTYYQFSISDQIPTREGYTFKGWRRPDFGIELDVGETKVSVDKFVHTFIVWAAWDRLPDTEVEYALYFEQSGVDDADRVPVLHKKVAADTCTFTIPEKTPVKEGYRFLYWTYWLSSEGSGGSQPGDESIYYPGDEVTISHEEPQIFMKPKWEEVYTLTFDGTLAEPASVPDDMMIEEDEDGNGYVMLPESPLPKRYGYRCVGYTIAVTDTDTGDAVQPVHKPGTKVLLEKGVNYTATPVWKVVPKRTVTLTLDGNGGQIDFNAKLTAETEAGKPASVKLPVTIPQREGYSFAYWGPEPEDCDLVYAPGASFTFMEDTTLYAHWEKDPTEPGKPGDSDQPGTPDQPGAPDTGDGTPLLMLTAMALLSGAGVVTWRRKRREG